MENPPAKLFLSLSLYTLRDVSQLNLEPLDARCSPGLYAALFPRWRCITLGIQSGHERYDGLWQDTIDDLSWK